MLDDLRNSSAFIEEEESPEQEEKVIYRRPARRHSKATFLGMTAQQRFILSLMMFLMVCILGAFALILTNSVVLPGM